MGATPRPRFQGWGMAKGKRTNLPPITPKDIAERPDDLRKTATGYAWKCAYCGKFASSVTQAGKYVCKAHGGVTEKQRDPVARAEAEAKGEPPPRPPGRPMVHGLYTKSPTVRIDQLVADYQARQVDPDLTDEDMLYLRAYIEEKKELRPDIEAVRIPLEQITGDLAEFLGFIVPDENVTVESVIDMLERGKELNALLNSLNRLLLRTTQYTKDLESSHARLITMSKVRAETRLKDAAARQLDVFTVLVRRFMVLLSEQLTAKDFEALQKRIENDLSEVPENLLSGELAAKA